MPPAEAAPTRAARHICVHDAVHQQPSPLRHELPFPKLSSCLRRCAWQMPFGKNKGLSMPRPKKKKVEAHEHAQEAKKQRIMEAAEEHPPPVAAQVAAPPSSPGAAKRKQAKEEEEEAYIDLQAMLMIDSDSKKEMQAAEKLYEARQRRIERRRGKGSVFGELDRIYKAYVDNLVAKNARVEVERDTQSAECDWHASRAHMLELENAKLRQLLRAHGHVRVNV